MRTSLILPAELLTEAGPVGFDCGAFFNIDEPTCTGVAIDVFDKLAFFWYGMRLPELPPVVKLCYSTL